MLTTSKPKQPSYQVQFLFPYKSKFIEFVDPYEATLITSHYQVNLLSGEKKKVQRNFLKSFLKERKLHQTQNYHVTHLFYEAASFLNENLKTQVADELPLALFMNFRSFRVLDKLAFENQAEFKSQTPKESEYQKKFNKVQEHLRRGDSYQVNLTERFKLQFPKAFSAHQFINRLWEDERKRAAYGSFSYIELFDWSLISNSPECLFQTSFHKGKTHIETMPIKGTVSLKKYSLKEAKRELFESAKEKSELYMITDLLRNDLYQVAFSKVEVTKKRAPLIVPNLLHQYSKIETSFKGPKKSLFDILVAMFPGGSVTGAPKMRTMEIISALESSPRGFYCGSTVIQAPNQTTLASINIRSGEYFGQKNEFVCGAGGGVTVKSTAKAEFSEMKSKFLSFIELL